MQLLTIKKGRKTMRRDSQRNAEIQLAKINQHLDGLATTGETPAMTVRRLVMELRKLKGERNKEA